MQYGIVAIDDSVAMAAFDVEILENGIQTYT